MKLKTKLIIGLLLFGGLGLAPAALVGTNSISLQAVATTTVNGLTNSIGSIVLPTRTHLIQHTGVSNTNALTVNVQISFDGLNWTTLGVYHPSSTNATVDTYQPVTNYLTGYLRVQAVTTNTVTVGVTTLTQ